ncbi:MAG: DUF1214 domain-containing protein [Rhizobiaceae bacterium]|nr:MAG: DUF1214 domain-containing protein [Rhizobiaceae bacterium]CAG0994763.1 hypothetical protein RHIZO_02449 [Rhizobiaceae bacterium]
MILRILLFLIVIAIAVGGGTASVWYVLRAQDGIGALTVGDWTAFPSIGTPAADPYARARIARDGILPLGRAEGLAFIAERDSAGNRLRRDCDYRVEGATPTARFWTLVAADPTLAALDHGGRPSAVQSRQILRKADNSFAIAVGPRPAPGNWIRIDGTGSLALVLTLYDTPVTGGAGLGEFELPQVLRTGCDA